MRVKTGEAEILDGRTAIIHLLADAGDTDRCACHRTMLKPGTAIPAQPRATDAMPEVRAIQRMLLSMTRFPGQIERLQGHDPAAGDPLDDPPLGAGLL